MIYLQSDDAFDAVARLSAPDARIEILAKSQSDEARSAAKTGFFATVDGRTVCLFRADGVLWLRIDERLLAVDDDVTAQWDLLRNERGAIPGDMTPFVDEEDYDYLLLVSRVLGDRGRREGFFAHPAVL